MNRERRVEGEPRRIQLRRTKGWRMPENTVKVDRTNKTFGNQFTVAEYGRDLAIRNYRGRVEGIRAIGGFDVSPLTGKNLACWCHLCDAHKDGKPFDVECAVCDPCHVDVLGPLANAPAQNEGVGS